MADAARIGLTLEHVVRNALQEQQRAERAERVAERHERLLAEAPPVRRSVHETAARLHRQAAGKHRMAAGFYLDFARRIEAAPNAAAAEAIRAPAFMSAVGRIAGSDTGSAALSLRAGTSADVILASDERARAAHDLEYTLGEGPGRDCLVHGPLSVAGAEVRERWGLYAAALEPLGFDSVVAAPLAVQERTVGSVVVFGTGPRMLADGVAGLTAVGERVLTIALDDALDEQAPHLLRLDDLDCRAVVHQATGIVSVQRSCSIDDATALLRARAFAEELRLEQLAGDVVAGRRSFAEPY